LYLYWLGLGVTAACETFCAATEHFCIAYLHNLTSIHFLDAIFPSLS
jgi:hypothetical protein